MWWPTLCSREVAVSNVPGPQCWAGPLSAAVARMCIALRPRMGERTAVGFGEVLRRLAAPLQVVVAGRIKAGKSTLVNALRSEEHTSELQSRENLVCRLLLEKKKT